MYLKMNVGAYRGEIRGPFSARAAKALLGRGEAVQVPNPNGDDEEEPIIAPRVEAVSVEDKTTKRINTRRP